MNNKTETAPDLETEVLHFLVERLGGHSVNIVRRAALTGTHNLLGFSVGKLKSFAIRDLLDLIGTPPAAAKQAEAAKSSESEKVERLAEFLCSDFDFNLNPCVGYSWPEHENDDGYRGDRSYVKLQPSDVQDYARENAKRILAFLDRQTPAAAPATEVTYESGCELLDPNRDRLFTLGRTDETPKSEPATVHESPAYAMPAAPAPDLRERILSALRDCEGVTTLEIIADEVEAAIKNGGA